jgi:hypothetical protein
MPNAKFDNFAAKIKPFHALWNSVQVNVLAARFQRNWITLATRLQTSEREPDRNCVILEPTSEMLFFSGQLPIQELGQLAFGLINDGRLQLRSHGVSECLYLSSTYAGVKRTQDAVVTWSDPWLQELLPLNVEKIGLRRPVIFLSGNNATERFIDFVDDTQRKQFESELRLGQPAFNGLKDLQKRHFQGLDIETYANCNVLIACQLPFELECSVRGLEVLMPAHVATNLVQVRGFFEPTRGDALIELKERGQNGPSLKRLHGDIPWPDGSERVNAALFYDRVHITDAEFSRWRNAGNIQTATDLFFDSDRKLLETGLSRLAKSGNQDFERAVVRLLTLLGVPAINYSSGDDRRPDIAATLVRETGKPLVLLGECTRERPIEKFSALRERASELSELLQNQGDILPLVFTQCDPVPSDYASASEHGIGLLGKHELVHLFNWLDSSVEVEEVVQFLKASVLPSDIPDVIRQSK